MKYALLILEDPTGESLHKLTLRNCVNQVLEGAKEKQLILVLNEGALLFPLEHGLHDLSLCVMEAKSRKVPFRTLFFDQALMGNYSLALLNFFSKYLIK